LLWYHVVRLGEHEVRELDEEGGIDEIEVGKPKQQAHAGVSAGKEPRLTFTFTSPVDFSSFTHAHPNT
jgi:hypothetical protein